MITICCTYFPSLGLANLEAALFSLWQQDLTRVDSLVLMDNGTIDAVGDIQDAVDRAAFPVPVRLQSVKPHDPIRTHAWSTNAAIREVMTPWLLFTRADYLLDFSLVRRFLAVRDDQPTTWDGFVTSNGCHLQSSIAECEQTDWRTAGPSVFRGTVFDYTAIDSGVWMARKDACDRVGGMDEALSAWGHAQTHFQWKLHRSGTAFVRIPEVLFYHPYHAAPRDLALGHQQLRDHGVNLKEMWARYEGVSPY